MISKSGSEFVPINRMVVSAIAKQQDHFDVRCQQIGKETIEQTALIPAMDSYMDADACHPWSRTTTSGKFRDLRFGMLQIPSIEVRPCEGKLSFAERARKVLIPSIVEVIEIDSAARVIFAEVAQDGRADW